MDCTVWQKALIRFALLGFCSNADLLFCQFDFCKDFIYQIVWIASDTQIWFEVCNNNNKKFDLKLQMFSSNFLSEELFLKNLSASPFINPFFTPGAWQEV